MATIKLEILLDSNEKTDVLAFSNLMNAFSSPVEALKRTVEAQAQSPSPSTGNKAEAEQITETTKEEYQNGYEYSEAEMLKLPNTDLKDYATGLGIDWAKAEGKNTNRKLADLVLAFRNGETKDQESPATEAVKDEATTETAEDLPKEDLPKEDLPKEDLPKEDDLGGNKITYNDLKVSLGKKVDQHRDAIVAKLAEFGATKMPNLDEDYWVDMFNFMEAL